MDQKQKTIKEEVIIQGAGLFTGNKVTLRLKPAPADSGIRFIRVDLPEQPAIQVAPENIIIDTEVPRCTSMGQGKPMVHMVEHLMSVLCGLEIDNLLVEIDSKELPGLDGSGIEFLKAIKRIGVVEQDRPREYIDIQEPIGVNNNGCSIFIVPDKEYKISYVLDYGHPFLGSQFFKTTINQETFEQDVAPCRTFCLEEEAKELQARGLGKGANYENTLVVGNGGVIKNEVRFADEFARHKVLDFVGDLYLLGKPIRGHVFAIKSGHALNIEVLKKIAKQKRDFDERGFIPDCDLGQKTELDIHEIMKILPHRYPFLLVDRIIELERGKRAVGIKNVTINDNFFAGHFPTRPVMPGVLMVEAMAQTGGILVLTNEAHRDKIALFLSADNVKFRKVVEPGDKLVIEVQVIKDKSRIALLRGQAKVASEVVAEADMVFSFTDASFLD